MKQPESKRFEALTGLRAVAATMVFLYHNRKYWREHIPNAITSLLNECHLGVSLFFVLSGFLIAWTYGSKPAASVRSYLSYILIRCARIFPVYWILLTVMYFDFGWNYTKFPLYTYTLVHSFSERLNLNGIAQAWSLGVEMTFYTLAPFLAIRLKKTVALIAYMLLLFLLAYSIGLIWTSINGNPTNFFQPIRFLFTGTFFGRSIEFVIGMLLANSISKKTSWLTSFNYKTLAGVSGCLICIFIISLFQKNIFTHGTETTMGLILSLSLFPLATALLIGGLILENTILQRILASRVMILLGNASFVFYLIHISYVNIRLREYVMLPDRNFVLLWILSIIIYWLIEKPLYSGIRTWTRHAIRSTTE
ncbi:MAG: acyltransferase family protein [Ferruginibacter sp.]